MAQTDRYSFAIPSPCQRAIVIIETFPIRVLVTTVPLHAAMLFGCAIAFISGANEICDLPIQ
jgi:hypothetical protein